MPNPARGKVTLQSKALAVANLYSLLGARIGTVTLDAQGKGQFLLGTLRSGLYLVRCNGETRRLVVE